MTYTTHIMGGVLLGVLLLNSLGLIVKQRL